MKNSDHQDIVTDFYGVTVQHGPLNNRIYLMDLNGVSPKTVIPRLRQMAKAKGYTKIFAKVPDSAVTPFRRAGYRVEAAVPGFFAGKEGAAFLGWYPEGSSRADGEQGIVDGIVKTAKKKAPDGPVVLQPLAGLEIRSCTEDDVEAMCRLYRTVFASYPFPIHDPGYLIETMRSHVDYFCVTGVGKIVALSSAEMDREKRNVEMTDFATAVEMRGRRLATHLLAHMEAAMRQREMCTAYTIARAASYAMNITFSSLGYAYGGVLINNTNIAGQIESMTIWHKSLDAVFSGYIQR